MSGARMARLRPRGSAQEQGALVPPPLAPRVKRAREPSAQARTPLAPRVKLISRERLAHRGRAEHGGPLIPPTTSCSRACPPMAQELGDATEWADGPSVPSPPAPRPPSGQPAPPLQGGAVLTRRSAPSSSNKSTGDGRTVFFHNVPFEMGVHELKEVFGKVANVTSLRLFRVASGRSEGQSKGQGLCQFDTLASAVRAIRVLYGTLLGSGDGERELLVKMHAGRDDDPGGNLDTEIPPAGGLTPRSSRLPSHQAAKHCQLRPRREPNKFASLPSQASDSGPIARLRQLMKAKQIAKSKANSQVCTNKVAKQIAKSSTSPILKPVMKAKAKARHRPVRLQPVSAFAQPDKRADEVAAPLPSQGAFSLDVRSKPSKSISRSRSRSRSGVSMRVEPEVVEAAFQSRHRTRSRSMLCSVGTPVQTVARPEDGPKPTTEVTCPGASEGMALLDPPAPWPPLTYVDLRRHVVTETGELRPVHISLAPEGKTMHDKKDIQDDQNFDSQELPVSSSSSGSAAAAVEPSCLSILPQRLAQPEVTPELPASASASPSSEHPSMHDEEFGEAVDEEFNEMDADAREFSDACGASDDVRETTRRPGGSPRHLVPAEESLKAAFASLLCRAAKGEVDLMTIYAIAGFATARGLDPTLLGALPAALKKEPVFRGPLDVLAIKSVEEELARD